MTVVLGASEDFVKSNEIFNPLVCMAIMDGIPAKEICRYVREMPQRKNQNLTPLHISIFWR